MEDTMKRVCLFAGIVLAISVSAQTPAPTSREKALQVARALGTAELDLFMSKHAYAPLAEAAREARRLTPTMSPIVSLDFVSGTSGSYLVSITTSSDAKHFQLSMTPSANDCSWSLFSNERGVIYFGKAIDCFGRSHGSGNPRPGSQ